MRLIFLAARIFPYWSLPVALIFAELGRHYYRKGSAKQYIYWALVLVVVVMTFFWFYYRGDLRSDRWVRSFFGG